MIWNVIPEKGNGNVSSPVRKHSKSLRLQKSGITTMLHHDGTIVTGTAEGRINFYDLNLKILYWCETSGLDSIRSISFDLRSTLLGPATNVVAFHEESDTDDLEYEGEFEECSETNMQDNICDEKVQHLQKMETRTIPDEQKVSSSLSVNMEHMITYRHRNHNTFLRPLPVDATLENAPFHVDNFFTSTATGTMALIEIARQKCHFISQSVGSAITSLDAHPQRIIHS